MDGEALFTGRGLGEIRGRGSNCSPALNKVSGDVRGWEGEGVPSHLVGVEQDLCGMVDMSMLSDDKGVLLDYRWADAVQPAALLILTGDCKGRARELLCIKPLGALLW